ncbi:trehalase family glycosidase, partial [Acinetobacter baumannii]|nr:trehalase family glycosidase [Acinetobacter baumannii]
ERSIATNCRTLKDDPCASRYTAAADARAVAINRHLWNAGGYYADYDVDADTVAGGRTAAMAFPLFVGIATPDRAQATAKALAPLIGE